MRRKIAETGNFTIRSNDLLQYAIIEAACLRDIVVNTLRDSRESPLSRSQLNYTHMDYQAGRMREK